ncbi:MAG: phosphosulfolactate synthase [Bacteroidales bacterium]|nr:MAG: phosphosulfolactate synthase [Bacteroidales bacterium]
MNVSLPHIPVRPKKPRETGLTMVMDKGLSLQEAENLVESGGDYIDLIKLGFGTSVITNKLKEKIRIYKRAKLKLYFGGTLFEVFIIRNMFNEYIKFIDNYGLEFAEVSDGSMYMPHEQKLQYIKHLAAKVTVLSEVGSKQKGVVIPTDKWINMMKKELEAGSWKVIAEARESGTTGIFHSDGTADKNLIDSISKHIDPGRIIWEAPLKAQQVWFIKLFGCNVNLGNIACNEVIPLETLRLGLRGDTFFNFLPDDLKTKKQQPTDNPHNKNYQV